MSIPVSSIYSFFTGKLFSTSSNLVLQFNLYKQVECRVEDKRTLLSFMLKFFYSNSLEVKTYRNTPRNVWVRSLWTCFDNPTILIFIFYHRTFTRSLYVVYSFMNKFFCYLQELRESFLSPSDTVNSIHWKTKRSRCFESVHFQEGTYPHRLSYPEGEGSRRSVQHSMERFSVSLCPIVMKSR